MEVPGFCLGGIEPFGNKSTLAYLAGADRLPAKTGRCGMACDVMPAASPVKPTKWLPGDIVQ